MIILVLAVVLLAIGLIPYVCWVISSFVGGAYLTFFSNRSLGLLYGDTSQT